MIESSCAPEFLEGIAIGELQMARRAVCLLVGDRFGRVDSVLQDYLGTLSDIVELRKLVLRAIKVCKWEELLIQS